MSQTDQLITDHIDIWTSAILAKSTSGRGSNKKYELYGITKLRELILELAVRGKLVPQYPNDEPASILLEKIAAEKAQLIKEKVIKKTKPLPLINSEDKPYELPVSWAWTRLGDTGISSTGKTPKTSETRFFNGDIPFVGPGQITTNNVILTPEKTLTEEGLEQSTEALEKDIMMVCIGGSIGKAAVVDRRIGFNQQINSIRPLLINHKYLLFALQAKDFYSRIISESTGSATPIINRGKWDLLLIGLPPLLEQHRIVAKVDELMMLCDDLEQQTEASIEAHATLVEVLLATLTDSADANDLTQNWARVSEHFESLFTTEQSIEALKQTVLQLAVMGKLVPQNPEDEPASVLLERIAEEKEILVKEKKIKRAKPLPLIDDDEKPFKLPRGWEWCKLGNLAPQFQNGASSRGDKEGTPITVLRLADIKNWQISLDDTRTLPISPSSIDRYLLADSDILIIRVNGSADIVGRFITCKRNYDAIYCDHFIRMRFPIISFSPDYLFLLGSSNLVRDRVSDLFISTAGQKTVNQGHLSSLVMPLPPLSEQYRIVAKVDELLQICDQLKSKLKQSQTTQFQLTDALVDRALA